MRQYLRMLRDLWRMYRRHPAWWKRSNPEHAERLPWPAGFGPRENPVYARNRIRTRRAPADLFQKLIRAEQWPEWYPNAIDVKIHPAPAGRFARGVPPESREARVPALVGAGGETTAGRDVRPLPVPDTIPGGGAPPELGRGMEFSWTTFGIRVHSRVTHVEQDRFIGWTAEAPGVRVYHRWFFRPDGEGTLVVTEECEKGLLVRLVRRLMNPALHAGHQLWLESLRRQ